MAKQTVRRTTTKTDDIKISMAPKTVTKSRTMVMPTEEQIRARAFEVYLKRKCGPGDAHSDWIQAERELRAELNR